MLDARYLFCDRDNTGAVYGENVHPFTAVSGGSKVYGRIHTPAAFSEGDRTPLAIFLHGFPGLERNMDTPYCLSRAGIAAAYFAFRGVWGSHGDYSFSHLIEDVFAVIDHLVARADTYRIDPERIYLIGHSMGGFTTMNAVAQGAKVRGAVLMCPCDWGGCYIKEREWALNLLKAKDSGYFKLAHENALLEDIDAHAEEWSFVNLIDKLPENIPLHFIVGSGDLTTPSGKHVEPVYKMLEAKGRKTSFTVFPDSHNLPMHRTTLAKKLFDLIEEMEQN
ncbi:MAG: alpha/beta fold hydrolase [Clostridia bacterium]|nr:alpha/beta fold hydrolase [Clostridia bacterium]